MVAAWSVDRLGRSLQDLIGTLNELRAKGVDLYLHNQGLDTATPAGKAMFQMLGVFAEFEREIIAERIHAGLARAREQGTKTGNPIGRPERFRKVRARAVALKGEGLGTRRIAKIRGGPFYRDQGTSSGRGGTESTIKSKTAMMRFMSILDAYTQIAAALVIRKPA